MSLTGWRKRERYRSMWKSLMRWLMGSSSWHLRMCFTSSAFCVEWGRFSTENSAWRLSKSGSLWLLMGTAQMKKSLSTLRASRPSTRTSSLVFECALLCLAGSSKMPLRYMSRHRSLIWYASKPTVLVVSLRVMTAATQLRATSKPMASSTSCWKRHKVKTSRLLKMHLRVCAVKMMPTGRRPRREARRSARRRSSTDAVSFLRLYPSASPSCGGS
mmetsp:Transcript_55628/g.146785  ORF Transcript_55628/g.146785 Transcript_55628/m.146785 type:complete len:216 (-) Transcript_55628:485-1132(-)